jgi:hypothetical protein
LCVERDLPELRPPEGRDVQRAGGQGDARRRSLRRRPGEDRIDVPAIAARSFEDRPAVVTTALDEVQLVETRLAELRRPQAPGRIPGEALDVPVTQAPDCRARVRVVVGDRPVGPEPENLPRQAVHVLGVLRDGPIADRDVEPPVRPERQPAAGVERRSRDTGEDDIRLLARPEAGDRVVVRRSVIDGRPATTLSAARRDDQRGGDGERPPAGHDSRW